MRVVVTGMGALAPNGNSVPEYWNSLISGKSGIDHISYFDTDNFPVKIAGEISNFNPEDYFERKEVRKLDLFSVYALVACNEAVRMSGLDSYSFDQQRAGVMIGCGIGGINTLLTEHDVLNNSGARRISPFFVTKLIVNIAGGQIAIKWNLKGPNQTVVSACASATDAIGMALRVIQSGMADIMIAGGTEASICDLPLAGFSKIRALCNEADPPQSASRPFDKDRSGFVMGEGAGLLVLETEEHAKSRGATILGELAGYGATNDAYHVTQPAEGGAGAVSAMQLAIKDAKARPENVHYINAHGTSTPFNDKNETSAIKTVFKEHAQNLKISSTKSMTGHLLGASGGIEAIAALKALQEQIIPPTINYNTPDPECDLDYVPNTAQEHKIDFVLSNTFGFGGHNAVVAMRKWRD
ncbi:MAG: beta-ketoacyl-ACP synthase II [Candidatus Neomarinimicrobiota bacterium]|nr:beta-ketoacyl-ACP synthase II [Candidatus Neomarinimicrobiota bacterium]MEC9106326.1 beta-ketoacyl-ACP synthase II [Candidatus Neomarinimicrobiota bacterium]MED5256819.1 beta-ketoacyl-ACP synthase II [Candidatus Neomarinimicrobiota bacterium]MED5266879.1 beta-ketoacyl-ACP synthase II [Candidatus Neomarinimicrobiota bacterium]|tara:strand:- start:3617 stop:4852 length:1236 start_codon:yes stop_codon:yes gene_type:complete